MVRFSNNYTYHYLTYVFSLYVIFFTINNHVFRNRFLKIRRKKKTPLNREMVLQIVSNIFFEMISAFNRWSFFFTESHTYLLKFNRCLFTYHYLQIKKWLIFRRYYLYFRCKGYQGYFVTALVRCVAAICAMITYPLCDKIGLQLHKCSRILKDSRLSPLKVTGLPFIHRVWEATMICHR